MKFFLMSAALVAMTLTAPTMVHAEHHKSMTKPAASFKLDKKEIQQLQQALREGGFNKKPVTGIWDENTTNSLYGYQKAYGLNATGKMNDETLKKLGLSVPVIN